MSLHPPTSICSGRLDDEEEKPRVLITNPVTERGSVHSTDQTAKGRPEWLFPRCVANMQYMLACSSIISKHDEENKLPHDLEILRAQVWGDDEDDALEFIVRRHTGNSGMKRTLERAYFHKECTHGIVVVVPCNPMISNFMESHTPSEEDKEEMGRKPLDMALLRILVEEEESMQAFMRNHDHHHHHGHD